MTENSTTESTNKSESTDKTVDVVHRAADLSDEVLKSVESGQRAAIDAVRKFVDTVDEAIPARSDTPIGARNRYRRRPGYGRPARHDAVRVLAQRCSQCGPDAAQAGRRKVVNHCRVARTVSQCMDKCCGDPELAQLNT